MSALTLFFFPEILIFKTFVAVMSWIFCNHLFGWLMVGAVLAFAVKIAKLTIQLCSLRRAT